MEEIYEVKGGEHLETCMMDGASIYDKVSLVASLFKKGTEKNMRDGLSEMMESINLMGQAVKDCELKGNVSEMDEIRDSLEFTDSVVYEKGQKLEVNGEDIFNHTKQMEALWADKDYIQVGREIGRMALKLKTKGNQSNLGPLNIMPPREVGPLGFKMAY
jgi:hypothetical protein